MARFAVFSLNYWPEPVGVGTYTAPYAEALHGAGHSVAAIVGYPHYPEWSAARRRMRFMDTKIRGVRVVRVPHAVPRSPTTLGRLRLEASYGVAAAAAASVLGPFEAALGVTPALSGGLAARLAATVRRRPYGVLVQDLLGPAAAHGGVPGSRKVARAVRAIEGLVISGATRVGVVARGFSEQAVALGAAHVDYLPNFATVGEASQARCEVRDRLGVPRDAFVVLYSGNLGYKQDFHSVIDAARLLADRAGIHFVIVGEGSQRGFIESALRRPPLQGRVSLLPLQAPADVPDVLASADLLLAPQRPTDVDMSVPSKLTAYLSAGRPVLAAASPASETARIVEESGAGVVVDPSDPEMMATAIRRLHDDPPELARLSAHARPYAQRTFDRDRALDRFVAFAERVAGIRP